MSGETETRRLLRAAGEGRLLLNKSGRYVIENESRPDRRTREKLLNAGLLTYTFRPPGLVLTSAGRAELDDAS